LFADMTDAEVDRVIAALHRISHNRHHWLSPASSAIAGDGPSTIAPPCPLTGEGTAMQGVRA
jgi:hypothetical protein